MDIETSTRSTSVALENVSTSPTGRCLTGIVVAMSAQSSTIRWPQTNCAMSIQCEPMSATARSEPPFSGSRRQFQSVG